MMTKIIIGRPTYAAATDAVLALQANWVKGLRQTETRAAILRITSAFPTFVRIGIRTGIRVDIVGIASNWGL